MQARPAANACRPGLPVCCWHNARMQGVQPAALCSMAACKPPALARRWRCTAARLLVPAAAAPTGLPVARLCLLPLLAPGQPLWPGSSGSRQQQQTACCSCCWCGCCWLLLVVVLSHRRQWSPAAAMPERKQVVRRTSWHRARSPAPSKLPAGFLRTPLRQPPHLTSSASTNTSANARRARQPAVRWGLGLRCCSRHCSAQAARAISRCPPAACHQPC